MNSMNYGGSPLSTIKAYIVPIMFLLVILGLIFGAFTYKMVKTSKMTNSVRWGNGVSYIRS